jgi:hypothetical protein
VPNKGSVAAQHATWKNRPTSFSTAQQQASRQALDRMAADLDAVRQRLMDLALGLQIVQVYSPGSKQYEPATEDQALQLASDPTLLPALLDTNMARIYVQAPDLNAIRTVMQYTMGKAPSAGEAELRNRLEEREREHQLLARVIQQHVPAQYYATIAAELERIAAGPSGD